MHPHTMKRITMTMTCLLLLVAAKAQEITPQHETEARSIVAQMTLEEKLAYINGQDAFYIRAIPRLGLPRIRMADGPQGVRNDTQSTMYPSVICATATWNRELAHQMGVGIGMDCRARGVDMILGPGVNIYRSPLAGRSFEYTGEDPYLASETALQYIRGVQEQGTMACIKHYAANNQEWDRHFVSSDVDERTMQEIYLPTFRKAVQQGHVAAIMDSYNLLNSVWATENRWLNVDVARQQWGFRGVIMSDWGAVHDDIAPILGGMDLEMPGGALHAAPIRQALEQGVIRMEDIDLMCQHIVQMILAYRDMPASLQELPLDNPDNCQRALDIALEGITLLKNEGNALPLRGRTMVLGPNADVAVMGGGSGEVHPMHCVTLWQGLQTALGRRVFLGQVPSGWRQVDAECFRTAHGEQGFDISFYNNTRLEGQVVDTLHVAQVAMQWSQAPVPAVGQHNYSDRLVTRLTAPATGPMVLDYGGDDGYRLYVDGQLVGQDWTGHATTMRTHTLQAVEGQTYELVMEHYQGSGESELYLSARIPDEGALTQESYLRQYRQCDNVVVALGWDRRMEYEGGDHTFSLPDEQLALLREAASHGRRIIVVVNGGGNPGIGEWAQWADAIVMAYYPGQEGGTALAQILTGQVCPSGHLPFTMEQRWEDNPTYAHYHDTQHTDHRRVRYAEGIFVGYRGYDRAGTQVAFPFGHGLSYTTFAYSNLSATVSGEHRVTVSFDVRNTGRMDGKEVCQVYVTDPECSVVRPVKELKGYEKVALRRGETRHVTIELDEEAFAYYDVESHRFVVEPGEFLIQVGGSSATLPLQTSVVLP